MKEGACAMADFAGKRWVRYGLIFLACAAVVPCRAGAATVQAEAIKTAITRHVEKSMPWAPGAVRVAFLSKIAEVVLPQESIRLEVQNKEAEDFIGDTDFAVKYFSGDALLKEDRVRARLAVLLDVAISARPLVKNQQLAKEDIQVLKKWVHRIPENVVTDPEEIMGKALATNLRANVEITRNILKAPLVVKKGKMVRIILDYGSLSISTVGVSEEDGAAESVIRVKNLASNQVIYARVAGDSLVKVEF